jgi:hypothetical protein
MIYAKRWLIGDHMTPARVPPRAKVFAVVYLSAVGVFWYVRQAFLEHAAGAARSVKVQLHPVPPFVSREVDAKFAVGEKKEGHPVTLAHVWLQQRQDHTVTHPNFIATHAQRLGYRGHQK